MRYCLKTIDEYCYRAKNLLNFVQYLICQSYRIHQKLKNGDGTETWEEEMAGQINDAIGAYNAGRDEKKRLRYINSENGFIADAYFLSWYLKTQDVYRAMPYATCSQICIQEKCREWKSFYKAVKAYEKDHSGFLGRPKKPGYLDPRKGRGSLVITSQNFSISDDGTVIMPGFLKGIRIKAKHKNPRQIRIKTDKRGIRIMIIYKMDVVRQTAGKNIMGIDVGMDNLITVSQTSDGTPFIINGRPLKSVNRYYNKKRAELQEKAKKSNSRDTTDRIERLTAKRNKKVRDYLHKASRMLINHAQKAGVGHIIIGNNRGWKQKVDLGKRTNQTFVSIPYKMLIDMICYKAEIAGIKVSIVRENYTSGTSYLDGETPDVQFYDKTRRIKRGMFRSNKGKLINADVNAAYQIMKAGGYMKLPIKENEKVIRINVA